jgi:hypothetical protein
VLGFLCQQKKFLMDPIHLNSFFSSAQVNRVPVLISRPYLCGLSCLQALGECLRDFASEIVYFTHVVVLSYQVSSSQWSLINRIKMIYALSRSQNPSQVVVLTNKLATRENEEVLERAEIIKQINHLPSDVREEIVSLVALICREHINLTIHDQQKIIEILLETSKNKRQEVATQMTQLFERMPNKNGELSSFFLDLKSLQSRARFTALLPLLCRADSWDTSKKILSWTAKGHVRPETCKLFLPFIELIVGLNFTLADFLETLIKLRPYILVNSSNEKAEVISLSKLIYQKIPNLSGPYQRDILKIILKTSKDRRQDVASQIMQFLQYEPYKDFENLFFNQLFNRNYVLPFEKRLTQLSILCSVCSADFAKEIWNYTSDFEGGILFLSFTKLLLTRTIFKKNYQKSCQDLAKCILILPKDVRKYWSHSLPSDSSFFALEFFLEGLIDKFRLCEAPNFTKTFFEMAELSRVYGKDLKNCLPYIRLVFELLPTQPSEQSCDQLVFLMNFFVNPDQAKRLTLILEKGSAQEKQEAIFLIQSLCCKFSNVSFDCTSKVFELFVQLLTIPCNHRGSVMELIYSVNSLENSLKALKIIIHAAQKKSDFDIIIILARLMISPELKQFKLCIDLAIKDKYSNQKLISVISHFRELINKFPSFSKYYVFFALLEKGSNEDEMSILLKQAQSILSFWNCNLDLSLDFVNLIKALSKISPEERAKRVARLVSICNRRIVLYKDFSSYLGNMPSFDPKGMIKVLSDSIFSPPNFQKFILEIDVALMNHEPQKILLQLGKLIWIYEVFPPLNYKDSLANNVGGVTRDMIARLFQALRNADKIHLPFKNVEQEESPFLLPQLKNPSSLNKEELDLLGAIGRIFACILLKQENIVTGGHFYPLLFKLLHALSQEELNKMSSLDSIIYSVENSSSSSLHPADFIPETIYKKLLKIYLQEEASSSFGENEDEKRTNIELFVEQNIVPRWMEDMGGKKEFLDAYEISHFILAVPFIAKTCSDILNGQWDGLKEKAPLDLAIGIQGGLSREEILESCEWKGQLEFKEENEAYLINWLVDATDEEVAHFIQTISGSSALPKGAKLIINLQNLDSKFFPSFNTCFFIMNLPAQYLDYDTFKNKLNTAIQNSIRDPSGGFGFL